MGNIIVLEGACDGIGKSTQFRLLASRLKNDGEEVVCHHFPSYGTYQGMLASKYLNGEFGDVSSLSPYFIHNLYAIDRAISWQTCFKKEYELGKNILFDRYTTSSLIYQSAFLEGNQKKEFIDYVCDFEYHKLGIQAADCVIFLYAPFDLVNEMRKERKENDGIVNDIHETNLEFMKRVYDNAMYLSDYLGFDKVKCFSNHKMRSIESIHEDVYRLVKKRH